MPTTPDRPTLPVFDIPAGLHAQNYLFLICADERDSAAVATASSGKIAGQGGTAPSGVLYFRRT